MDLRRIAVALLCALPLAWAVALKAQEPAQQPGQQLLLLRNGQSLEGRVSRSGDIYHVVLANGEIRVKAADVQLICSDIEEAYRRKHSAAADGSMPDHLDLAQWCERNKLYDHAAAELDAAEAIAPGSPVVAYFRRRLEMAAHPPPDRPKAGLAGDQSLSNRELDRMVRSLPHRAVENFTQSVQPLLVNNCTMAGCHGPQSQTGLRLERISPDQPAGRRPTQRNIHAVLQYVDRNNPLASKILTVPAAPHGKAKTAVFSDRQATQYKRLVQWVLELSTAAAPDSLPAQPDGPQLLADTAPETPAFGNIRYVPGLPGAAAAYLAPPTILPAGATAGLPSSARDADANSVSPSATGSASAWGSTAATGATTMQSMVPSSSSSAKNSPGATAGLPSSAQDADADDVSPTGEKGFDDTAVSAVHSSVQLPSKPTSRAAGTSSVSAPETSNQPAAPRLSSKDAQNARPLASAKPKPNATPTAFERYMLEAAGATPYDPTAPKQLKTKPSAAQP